MSREEQRKVDRQIKEKKKIEADLEPERILREEIDMIKRKVQQQGVYIERVRGYVAVEGKEPEETGEYPAYELICNFNELSLREMRRKLKAEELGVVIYGRNLQGNEQLLKEILKCGRTQLK